MTINKWEWVFTIDVSDVGPQSCYIATSFWPSIEAPVLIEAWLVGQVADIVAV